MWFQDEEEVPPEAGKEPEEQDQKEPVVEEKPEAGEQTTEEPKTEEKTTEDGADNASEVGFSSGSVFVFS